jgi:hypothetical protein
MAEGTKKFCVEASLIQEIGAEFKKFGFGMVCVFHSPESLSSGVECMATISAEEICELLVDVAMEAATFGTNVILGADLLKNGDSRLDDLVLWARSKITWKHAVIVVCVAENNFAVWAQGPAPMVTYSAARIAAMIGK